MAGQKAFEANFDGLVGPTHNYAGLSYGNVASMNHKAQVSNPREAALQGLRKMKALADLGLKQGVLPPQERPDARALRRLGFRGDDAEVLGAALKVSPELLAAAASASSMWTANAATVCPSADADDGRVHFVAANLTAKFHRSIEHETTTRMLQAIFKAGDRFAHHPALPPSGAFGDEGAANHTRFCRDYADAGLHFFVYGRIAFDVSGVEPRKFPARQTLEASQAVARLCRADPNRCVFAQQNPEAIDAGAFHNDVVAVGDRGLLFCHERAFRNQAETLSGLSARYRQAYGEDLRIFEAPEREVPLIDAIKSYLFNSQLLSLPSGTCLIAPEECRETESVRRFLEKTVGSQGSEISEVRYFDLRQSMRNGGGPACLRLRVVLTESELPEVNRGALLDQALFEKLQSWINRYYRDRLSVGDLADPALAEESREALDAVTDLMNLGSIYPFQLERSGLR